MASGVFVDSLNTATLEALMVALRVFSMPLVSNAEAWILLSIRAVPDDRRIPAAP